MRNRVVAVSSNLVAEQKKKSGNALFIRLPRLVATIQTHSYLAVCKCSCNIRFHILHRCPGGFGKMLCPKSCIFLLLVSGNDASGGIYNGAQTAFGRAFQIYVLANGDGTYFVDDILGGWYCQRAGYGTNYAMQAHIKVSGDVVELVDSYIPGWGDSLVYWADGTVSNGTISYTAVYVSGMEFHVTMSK